MYNKTMSNTLPLWKNWSPPHKHLIGHRGAAAHAPENTLAGFKKAHELGFNWLELDIQPCLSGEWVVFHDDTLDRTTNGKGWICDTPYETIKSLDAGSWFDCKFKNEPIPSLSEAIQCITDLKLFVNIEIKDLRQTHSMTAKKTHNAFPKFNQEWSRGTPNKASIISSFLKELDKSWPKNYPLPLISSFDLEILLMIGKENKNIPISYLVEDFSKQALNFCKKNRFFSLNCDYRSLPAGFKAEGNVPILTYTVNDHNIIKQLIDSGIAAVFTDTIS